MTVDDALERFLVQIEADGRSSHTIGQYRRHVRLLARWLQSERHSRRVDKIDHELLATFFCSPDARCRPDGKTKKATSTNALRTSIRCFFAYLHQAGRIRSNPARLIRRAICGNPLPRALSDAEQKRLLGVLSKEKGEKAKRDHALFHLMLTTGIRVGSVAALNVEDVDLDAGELWLRSTKGDRPERVFLGRRIVAHLRRWTGDRATGPLFEGHRGRLLTARHIARRFDHWLRQARIQRPATPHSLRHTFATGLYKQTGDVLLVKEALLHQSLTSTLVYATLDRSRLRTALDA